MEINVWVGWPSVSVEKSKKCNDLWQSLGYKTCVLMDGDNRPDLVGSNLPILQYKWDGFPRAANMICKGVPGDVVVLIGDDIFPDKRFKPVDLLDRFLKRFPDTMGVVSPTGDKFGSIENCCIAPWIGRKFIQTAYGGSGPYCEQYFHYYSDAELQCVARKYNCFEKWPDVSQYHDHWQRREEKRPAYLQRALERFSPDQALFEQRKKDGFPNA